MHYFSCFCLLEQSLLSSMIFTFVTLSERPRKINELIGHAGKELAGLSVAAR